MSERLADLELEEHEGGVYLARVIGEIDSSNADELRLALTERLPSVAVGLALDLSRIGYVDSAGVQLLFDLAGRLAARRQAIRLVVPVDAPPRRVLDLCDVGRVAPLDATVEEALDALGAPDPGF